MANTNIQSPSFIIFLTILLLLPLRSTEAMASYNVKKLGARADGRSDATKQFIKAWSLACRSRTPSQIYVPRGTYLVKNLAFEGPCRNKITFRVDGTLVAPKNYWEIGNAGYWILFSKVNRVSVVGGTFDARGSGFWSCRRSGGRCPTGARSISFSWCNKVVVSGVTSINSQTIHISLHHSNDVRIQKVKIRAPSGSPNTDGIHMQSCSRVTVTRTTILTGDDCISLSQGSKNVWIDRINCGPGHGISIGSLGDSLNEEGVENVTVTSSVFTKTQNGVRIKSWARRSNGYARNIVFRNLVMNKVSYPLIIDQNYCPYGKGCPNQGSGVKISGITYSNIRGTSATAVAMKFDCNPKTHCTGLRVRNIHLTYMRRPATSYCKNAHGKSAGVAAPTTCL